MTPRRCAPICKQSLSCSCLAWTRTKGIRRCAPPRPLFISRTFGPRSEPESNPLRWVRSLSPRRKKQKTRRRRVF